MMLWRTLPCRVTAYTTRCIHFGSSAQSYKYAERLHQKAKEKGLDLEELISQAREEARCKQKQESASVLASFKKSNAEPLRVNPPLADTRTSNVRKDSSPVKPLASILNLPKLMATPHTPSQISALWTAYHASRNKGTGKGYICASIPSESYDAMTRVAKRYPVFVIPVPRDSTSDRSASGSTGTAHEFFFLQWDFHPASSSPALDSIPPQLAISGDIPESSTVLFTPLQEYKLRTSFATPYLVLTFYTDILQSHGIVLLRGEITPSSSGSVQPTPERFLLNQVDAQLLAMGLQKFYLWGQGRKEADHGLTAEALLKTFHEEPEKFDWQDLLKFSDAIV